MFESTPLFESTRLFEFCFHLHVVFQPIQKGGGGRGEKRRGDQRSSIQALERSRARAQECSSARALKHASARKLAPPVRIPHPLCNGDFVSGFQGWIRQTKVLGLYRMSLETPVLGTCGQRLCQRKQLDLAPQTCCCYCSCCSPGWKRVNFLGRKMSAKIFRPKSFGRTICG